MKPSGIEVASSRCDCNLTPELIHTDETYYVLQGVLTAKIADKTYELPAGSYILIPHGTPHAQGNLGNVPVKVLLTMTPGGFEGSFKDRAELIKTVKPDDPNFIKKREQIDDHAKIRPRILR